MTNVIWQMENEREPVPASGKTDIMRCAKLLGERSYTEGGDFMYFKQFYLGCLAHGSYLVGSGGEAAVIDPQRDIEQYINEAEAEGLKIKYVIETHLHADFVSGHRELAERTGAKIVFGRKAGAAIDYSPAKDGDEFRIGKVILRVMETPGHT